MRIKGLFTAVAAVVLAAVLTLSGTAAHADQANIIVDPDWKAPVGADAAAVAARKPWMEPTPKGVVLHIDIPQQPGQTFTPEQLLQITAATESLLYLPDYDTDSLDNLTHDVGAALGSAELTGPVTVKRDHIQPGDAILSAPVRFKAVRRLDADLVLKAGGFHTLPAGTLMVKFSLQSRGPGAADHVELWCTETRESEILGISYPTTVCLKGDEGTGYALFSSAPYSGAESGIPYIRGGAFQQRIETKPVWHDADPNDLTFTYSVTYEGADDKGAVFHVHLSRLVDGKAVANNQIDTQIYPNGKYNNLLHKPDADGLYLYAFPSARLYFRPDAAGTLSLVRIRNHDVRPELRGELYRPASEANEALKTKPWRFGVLQLSPDTLTRVGADARHVTFTVKGHLAEAVELTEDREEREAFGTHMPGFVKGSVFYRSDETATLQSGIRVRLRGWCGPVQTDRNTPPTVVITCFRDDQTSAVALDFTHTWQTVSMTTVHDDLGKMITPKLPANQPHPLSDTDDKTVFISVVHDDTLPVIPGVPTLLYAVVSQRDFAAGWDATLKASKADHEGLLALESYISRLYRLRPDASGHAVLNLWDKRLVVTQTADKVDAVMEDGGDGFGIHAAQ